MVQNLCSRLIQPKAGSRGFGVGLSKLRLTLDVKVFVLMHSNFVRGLLKPWTTAAHALFSIISQTFTADRRAFHWRENEFCLHLQSGKRRIEIHVKKRNVRSAPEEKQILLICSELEIAGTSRWNHSTDRCQIFQGGFRISFPIFFDQLITWEPNTNLDRRDSLKWKRQWKKQRFLRAKVTRLAFLLVRAIVASCKRNYPKTRHQNRLRHHWTDLATN